MDEELQERLAAHVFWLELTRSSHNGQSCMMMVAGGGLGSGVAELIPHSSGEVRFLFSDALKEDVLCQCEVGQQHSLSFHPSSRRGVRWRISEFTDDDPKAAHLLVVFPSEELALQFKDAFEAAQASPAQ